MVIKVFLVRSLHTENTGTETHFVRATGHECTNITKRLRGVSNDINITYLMGYRTGKEVVDKFIAGYIHRAVAEGFDEITVVSSDYDFVDIFKMATQINTLSNDVTFKLIDPQSNPRIDSLPNKIVNIEIIKM